MISLQKRLNYGLVFILSTVLSFNWLAADIFIKAVVEKQMITRLIHDSDTLIDTFHTNNKNQLVFNSLRLESVYDQEFSGHYYVVKIDGKTYYSKSLNNEKLDIKEIQNEQTMIYHQNNGPHRQPLLILEKNLLYLGHQINIAIAEDLTNIYADIIHIRLAYLGLSIVVLVISILWQTLDVKRSLNPLILLTQELEDMSNGKTASISTARVPVEVKPLVLEINRLLGLVFRRLQQSRNAVGNLSHALKTPLAVLFTLAESEIISQYPELQQKLKSQTKMILHHIERELKRTRIAGSQQSVSVFNPCQEINLLVGLLQRIYADKQININVIAPNKNINFDREDFLEVLGNLVDNACKWARGHIQITVTFDNGLVMIVADDGPGCPEQEIPFLPQRGFRVDQHVSGHGLGLAIIQDIVEFYNGNLIISRSPDLGGLLATVIFPLSNVNNN